jgi:GAF domain-containing protein
MFESEGVMKFGAIEAVLKPILNEALALTRSDKGNIQLFDVPSGCLTIEAQCGFDDSFLETFRSVSAANGCACGRAIRLRRPVAIADVLMDDEYLPYRQAAAEAGYRSVISLPLIAPGDNLVGVMSVHRVVPGLRETEIEILNGITEFAADAITRHRYIDKTRQSRTR